MTLHSILGLGGGRVEKKKRPSTSTSSTASSSSASKWTNTLPLTKRLASSSSPKNHTFEHEDFPHATRPTTSLPPTTNNLLTAHAHALLSIFSPLPARGIGLSSVKLAAVLTARDALPSVVTAGHLRVAMASPTEAERELARLVGEGVLRRVVVPRRVLGGELVIKWEALESMVMNSKELGEEVRSGWVAWLRRWPGKLVLEGEQENLGFGVVGIDGLVRAGFLTAIHDTGRASTGVYARPAERHALLSLDAVARAAAGSVGAVGGNGAVYLRGETGSRGRGRVPGRDGTVMGRFAVSVPGAGTFFKLVDAGLEHLKMLLKRTPQMEIPASDLREKWDGGVVGESQSTLAKTTRGGYVGILPGRTKKWKDLNGMAFDWILHEAVGAGVVEVFETGSVGLGVRLV